MLATRHEPATAQDVMNVVYEPLPKLLRDLSKNIRLLGWAADPESVQNALRQTHEISNTLRRLDTVFRREDMYG